MDVPFGLGQPKTKAVRSHCGLFSLSTDAWLASRIILIREEKRKTETNMAKHDANRVLMRLDKNVAFLDFAPAHCRNPAITYPPDCENSPWDELQIEH